MHPPHSFPLYADGATSSNIANDLCKVAIILPSEASLLNIIHHGGIETRMLTCSDHSIFVGKFAENFHVAMTTGYSRTLFSYDSSFLFGQSHRHRTVGG